MTSINNYESVELVEVEEKEKKTPFAFMKKMKTPKFHFTIKKKYIALASLVLMLSAAVYVNYLYTSGEIDTIIGATKNYGDSILVDGNAEKVIEDVSEYFSAARLSRQQSREEAVETIHNLYAAEENGEEQMASLNQKAEEITTNMELENKIESMMKAKGFNDCVVYISDEYADVMVETDGLLATEAALIKETIIQETSVPVENISIVEISK